MIGSDYLGYQIAVFICILLSAFFSGTETALVSVRKIKMRAQADAGDRGAKRAVSIINNSEETLSVLLVGNNLVNIAATSFITFIATRAYLLDDSSLAIVTGIQAAVFLLFAEVMPKLIARSHAEFFIKQLSVPVLFFIYLLKPLVLIITAVTGMVKKLLKVDADTAQVVKSREEIELLFQIGGEHGAIDEEDKQFVFEILSFKELKARDIMTPTVEIESVEENDSTRTLIELFRKSGFSRIPVYRERVDTIIGYVFYRDIFKGTSSSLPAVKDLMIKAHYVPLFKSVFDLYHDMLRLKISIVFVVDEYGGVVGMITHEDIAEEIVGEIQTRDHDDEVMIEKITNSRYLLDAGLSIEYLRRFFGLEIEKKGFETVGGFIMEATGTIPRAGEKIKSGNAVFTVEEADERSIHKISMTLIR